MRMYEFKNAADIENLAKLDRKEWMAMSCPVKGLRFDTRMLELMDSDHDGRIRMDEVLAAITFLQSKGVDLSSLFCPSEADAQALAGVTARQAALEAEPPTDAETQALAEWEAKGKTAEVAILGEATAEANGVLSAIEGTIDAFFAPEGESALVTEEGIRRLPLKDHINARYLEAVIALSEKVVQPILGARDSIDMLEWKRLKGAFAAFRAWAGAKPVMAAGAKAALDDEERILRYKLNLLEFLENYVSMKRLYDLKSQAIFQTGILRLAAREFTLCFHVDAEAAHAALSEKSDCCVLYLKCSRPAEGAERTICAVVTAGTIRDLYVGRNGVFIDAIGKDWEAVVTKIVEAQVSLGEAFWAPWRKLGEGVAGAIKKFIGAKQSTAMASVQAGTANAQAGGAAMASSVAAIGIGVGMVGTAMAAIVSAIRGIQPAYMLLVYLAAVVLVVSVPSVILTYFKLRKRDLGAILNASGWAINRPMRFSMRLAASFTRCLPCVALKVLKLVVAVLLWLVVIVLVLHHLGVRLCPCAAAAEPVAKWDVVPGQRVVSPFEVGVVAFHEQPMTVEFFADGKSVATVSSAKMNPRTGVNEYFFTFDPAGRTDGEVEMTARVTAGSETRTLGALRLFANARGGCGSDTVIWVDSKDGNDYSTGTAERPVKTLSRALALCGDGGTINCRAGEYSLKRLGGGFNRKFWTTIRPAPGLKTGEVKLRGGRPATDKLRLQNLDVFLDASGTREMAVGGEGASRESCVWLDNCRVYNRQGADAADTVPFGNRITAYVTGGMTVRMAYGPCYAKLVRSHKVAQIVNEAFSGNDVLVVNSQVLGIDPGTDTEARPVLFQGKAISPEWVHDVILYGVNGVGVRGNVLLGVRVRDSAFVDIDVETTAEGAYTRFSDSMDNVYFSNVKTPSAEWDWHLGDVGKTGAFAPKDVRCYGAVTKKMYGYPETDGSTGLLVR